MKEKIAKIMVVCIIIGIHKFLYAPDEVKKEGGQIQWVEPTRGWDENGTNLWTAILTYNVGIGTNAPAYKLDVTGNSRIQGDLYINSWPISVTSTPTVGYVLKWNGTAFVPQEDAGVGDCEWLDAGSYLYPRDQSAGNVYVYEDATSAKIIAIQTNASYVAIGGEFLNGPFGQLGSSSYGVFGRYRSGGTPTNMYGYIGLSVWGVYGNSDNTSGGGVGGFGGTTTTGVYGQTNTSAAEFGVMGVNTNASGSGILGLGSNVLNLAWSGQGDGVVGASDYYGVIGSHYNGTNNNRWGALGTPYHGVYGASDNTYGAGVWGYGGTVTTGVYGVCNVNNDFGVWGHNLNTSGTGVVGSGNGVSAYSLTDGSGGAFTGTRVGAVGFFTSTAAVKRSGGYFTNASGSQYAYVCYLDENGANYKIIGTGTVSSIMNTRGGKKTLFAPESPEAWVEDFGEGQLKNGRSGKITLDPYFLDCVVINEQYPLKVFVQLYDDCNGVYVKRYSDGFEVIELRNGTSNARFSYRVVAKWKGYENLRFPEAPEPLQAYAVKEQKIASLPEVKTVKITPKYPVPPAEFKMGIEKKIKE